MKTTNLRTRLLSAVFALIFAFSFMDVQASSIVFHLHCDKTTEAGEDEVYYLVTAVKSDGSLITSRLPGPEAHWDMNDNNKRPDVQNVILAKFDLLDGQSMKVVVSLMEEDGGTAFGWLDYSKQLEQNVRKAGISSPVPVAPFVDLLKSFIPNITDTDDWIGTFQIDISKANGRLTADWSAVQRSTFLGYNPTEKRTRGDFRFDGDGTNYYGWGKLNP